MQRNKTLIISDSPTRDCSAELSTSVGYTFDIVDAVISGSRLQHIMCLAYREISQLHRDDFVIIWGGANDMDTNESNTGLRHIRKFTI